MKFMIFTLLLVFSFNTLYSQKITKIEPPHWYQGMQNPELQLMIYGSNIQNLEPRITNSKGVLKSINIADSKNYLFLNLDLSAINKAENIEIEWYLKNTYHSTTTYQIKSKVKNFNSSYTFDSKDVIYLITPDRYANGDSSNDVNINLRESYKDRGEEYARHGGDIQGIIDYLDYIEQMGFTSIWLNPVLENDQPKWSYHGYAMTDFYNIDPRFGTNDLYRELSRKAKAKGIGLIMDVVSNHCGDKHWWMDDLPFDDWINYQNAPYQETNHRKSTLIDPYVAPSDRQIMVKGWFVPTMPDLNQENAFLSKYLIQNTIWWIEYADLYGIRQDTYSYPDKDFMSNWTCNILKEYPNFNIVGEEWSLNPSIISYWQRGKENKDGYESCLRSIMDFPLNAILIKAFKEEESWGTGLVKLYDNLALDYLYHNTSDMLVFADNHDMDRVATSAEENPRLVKMAMAYILTTRGVPQILYGTEILMSHIGTKSHGAIRADFPGGWDLDTVNGFTGVNLSKEKSEFQNWLKTLLNWRKTKGVIHDGKIMHYTPEKGTYVYFRYNDEETIMIVFNKNKTELELDLNRFKDNLRTYSKMKNIFTNDTHEIKDNLKLSNFGVEIFELIR